MKQKKTKAGSAARQLQWPAPEKLALAGLNYAPYNPRHMPPEKMRALKASLRKHGVVLNLVVQKKSEAHGENVIIGGHQRVLAVRELASELGLPPVEEGWGTVLDVDDATAKQLNVALNNIEGEFDPHRLGEVFRDILPAMTVDDVLATGFRQESLEELIKLAAPVDEQAEELERQAAELGLTDFAKSITLSVEFDTVEDRDAAKELLKEAAAARGAKAGKVVLELVRASSAAGSLNGKPEASAPARAKKDAKKASAKKAKKTAA